MKKGIFYAVGVGPGAPELITLKAVRVFGECSVIAPPRTSGGEMLALDILKGAVNITGKTVLPIDFTMSHDANIRAQAHNAAADIISERLNSGESVAMPNLGDVSIYASCSYIAELLKNRGFETVMIPGVTSFSAIGALLGESLTDMDKPLHIIPAGSTAVSDALDYPGTKVFMKSGKSAQKLRDTLLKAGKTAAAVENCGLPGEKIYRDITEIPDETGYFTTFIVKE